MKVGTKLLGGFLTVAAIILIVAFVGYQNMKSINDGMTTLYNDRTLPILQLGTAETRIHDLPAYLAQYVLIPQDRDANQRAIEQAFADVDEQMKLFRATYRVQEESDELARFDEAWDTYQYSYNEALASAKSGDEQAAIISIANGGEVANARQAVSESINKLTAINVRIAEETHLQGENTFVASTWVMIAAGTIGVLLAVGLGFFLSNKITKPLERATWAAQTIADIDMQSLATEMNALARGDLTRTLVITAEALSIDSKDELGRLSVAFNGMITRLQESGEAFAKMAANLRNLISEVAENASSLGIASGQLASAANEAGQATSQISTTIQQVAKGTAQQSESVNRTATSVEQMSRAIDGVARGAQDQTQAVTKAAQVTSQIAAAIQQVSVNAQAGAKGSEKAAAVALRGAETVNATLKGMQTIQAKVDLSAQKVHEMGARSEQIGVIVETIEDIASQTNLLALNAAIEAARVEAQGEKTVENILQQHMLCAVSLVANILESGRELQSSDLITLADHARVEVLSISNADGVIIASNDPACLGFRFSENSKDQSSICRPLLNKRDGIAIQPIMARDNDSVPFLYVAISRRDRPGIIQAGTDANVVYRLGGYSRGFSIVADEVRKLAERSANAMKEITGLVKSIQRSVSDAVAAMNAGSTEVERGVEQANQAGTALEQILSTAKQVNEQVVQIASAADQMNILSNELVAATDAVSAVVEENTAATEEMSAGSTEVTRAIENIASISEENSAAVEEVSASAEEMSAQVEEVSASAQSLAEMAQALQQIVAQFKLVTAQKMPQEKGQAPSFVFDDVSFKPSMQRSNGHSQRAKDFVH